ncbi:MAG: hypothetical protein ACE5K2_05500 [Candidatus Zixiibacteriota bacterium]
MKRITIFPLLSIALLMLFVFCEDKSNNPPPRDDPRFYYPLQKDHAWRYFQEGRSVIPDTFELRIVGTNKREGNVGFDRLLVGSNDTIFIYEKGETLFAENVQRGVPLFKILVGPIKAGTSWKDENFDYVITGFEDVTLAINGEPYRNCAKIIKKYHNPTPGKPDKIYEWWAPGFGEAKEIWVDTSDVSQYTKELLYFSPTGIFP